MEFSNINTALLGLLSAIGHDGRVVSTRGSVTREIGPVQLTLEHPDQRCLVLPHRNNNIFAAVAETMWVLAGRNDIGFLQHYLPRAGDFSDDGVTWRAGYGPRLRDWDGVDQIDAVRQVLLGERTSRRAVAAIFDPAQDYVDSKDIPCNNWLHFVCRDDALSCHVAVRSNDVVWGLSGINAFEWSVLLEMMAYWTNADLGRLTFSVTSAHIYEHHFARAETILSSQAAQDPYAASELRTLRFGTAWTDFSARLEEWFAVEETIRCGTADDDTVDRYPDPLLRGFLQMIRVHWATKNGASASQVARLVEPLEGSDLGEAALEYASRKVDGFGAYDYAKASRPAAQAGDGVVPADLGRAISSLHAAKTAAYGDSWKRRGERIGIMANIARKVDRLQNVDPAADGDETALDTAVDLFVYAAKYATYLMDVEGMARPDALRDVTARLSDGTQGFDAVLADALAQEVRSTSVREATDAVRTAYEALEDVVEQRAAGGGKVPALRMLVNEALTLVVALVHASPATYRQFVDHVTREDGSPRA